jgi:transposase
MTAQRPKYSIDFKKEVCQYAKKENIKSAAAIYGVHHNTVSVWLKRYSAKGTNGLVVTRKNYPKLKLSSDVIKKLKKYKKKNPSSTLNQLKEHFSLDCHITLIGRKISNSVSAKRGIAGKESLYLKLKVIKQTTCNQKSRSVYRLSLHKCDGKLISAGFAGSYFSRNICLFIRYSLEKLRSLSQSRNIRTVYTLMKCIKDSDFKNIVEYEFGTELKVLNKDSTGTICLNDGIEYTGKEIGESIGESIEEILKYCGSDKKKMVLISSLVNVDNLYKENKSPAEWKELPMPSETRSSLMAVLHRIKEKGDSAVMNFDYETALGEYDRAYFAVSTLGLKDELFSNVLLDRAKLLYLADDLQAAVMMFQNCIKVSRKLYHTKVLGDSYYFMGMIFKYFKNTAGALRYFKLSARVLKKITGAESECMHYRAVYRSYLTENKFDLAEKASRLYYEKALKTGKKDLIGNCLSTKCAYLYMTDKPAEYEVELLKAKEFNLSNGNYHDACNDFTNFFSIYSYSVEKDLDTIQVLTAELDGVLKIIKKPHLKYNNLLRLGIYYFNKGKFEESDKILRSSLPGVKKYLSKESYFSNLYYLGRICFEKEQYSKASRFILPLAREAEKCKESEYSLHSSRLFTKILLKRNDHFRLSRYLNKMIILATKSKMIFVCGEFHDYYAELCGIKKMRKKALYHYTEAKKYFEKYSIENNYDLSNKIKEINTKIEKYICRNN